MNDDFNPDVISNAFRFYSRVLVFPYDELTHELHHLLREVEKNIESDVDNTIATTILDVINYYQGEEMQALQAEYSRMFAPIDETPPLIPISLSDLNSQIDTGALSDLLSDSALILESEEYPDSFLNIMDYLAFLLEHEPENSSKFFKQYIYSTFPEFCQLLFQGSTLGFYKEAAKGLDEMIRLIE